MILYFVFKESSDINNKHFVKKTNTVTYCRSSGMNCISLNIWTLVLSFTVKYMLPDTTTILTRYFLKLHFWKWTTNTTNTSQAGGRALTSEMVAVFVVMLDWPFGRSIIPTPSSSSTADHSSSSNAAKSTQAPEREK